MRIIFLADTRERGLLGRSLKGLSGQVQSKVERALGTLERSSWPEAVEGKLVSQLGKPGNTWVYQIKIGGNPQYRIATIPKMHGEEQCLLIGDIVTREYLNSRHNKILFLNKALEAMGRWADESSGGGEQ